MVILEKPGDGPERNGAEASGRPVLPSAFRLHTYDRLDSTMDEARRLAANGAEDGTLIWALEQTAGRGRLGAAWASPPGNFYGSLIVRPDCAVTEAAQLGFVTALAIGAAIGSVMPPLTDMQYKWPNDILVNGGKAAGILLESRSSPAGGLDYLIIGTGVNLLNHPDDARYRATNLALEGRGAIEPARFLEAYARYMLRWVHAWLSDGFPDIRRAWLRHAAGLGETITVRQPDGLLSGRFVDLAEDGVLLLDTGEGAPCRIHAGEILARLPAAGE